MKNVLIAAAAMAGIIVIRMILSITFTDQAAEVFARAAVGILFFYFIGMSISRKKLKKNAA